LEVLISPTNFLFYVEFSPFEIGAIKFLRSPTNHTHGPLARVEGSLIPFSFSCNIEGFIDVFLFKSYVKILVQSRTMQFHVDAVLFVRFWLYEIALFFNLIHCFFHLSASWKPKSMSTPTPSRC
jgi:hypothetical protein